MKQIEINSLNISVEKGTKKVPVDSVEVDLNGMVGDAHAGAWHRQISLLSLESLGKFQHKSGRPIEVGELGENITTSGQSLSQLNVFDRLRCGDIEIEITQIGKKCHGKGCDIFNEVGECVMPVEGIFGRVISGGTLKVGDTFDISPKPVRIAVITLSDRASRGVYKDLSGPHIIEIEKEFFADKPYGVEFFSSLIGDDKERLEKIISEYIRGGVDIIFTTGGTGLGPRDITPDVVKPMLDREIPGIMEYIRVKYAEQISASMISRSVAGMIGKTLIFTLPGSVKAVVEYLEVINKTLPHSLLMINDINTH